MTEPNKTQDQSLETRPNGDVERTREARVLTPPADILETEGAFELTLDLPGVDPASLDLTFEDGVLTLRAKSRVPAAEGYTLAHTEFELGDYHRSFEVNEHVDADGIEANLRHGVLTIRLPKAKPEARKVEVAVSTS